MFLANKLKYSFNKNEKLIFNLKYIKDFPIINFKMLGLRPSYKLSEQQIMADLILHLMFIKHIQFF